MYAPAREHQFVRKLDLHSGVHEGSGMARDVLTTTIARIAALRARVAYRSEKQRLQLELREARQRGEDQGQFLAGQEKAALTEELLVRFR